VLSPKKRFTLIRNILILLTLLLTTIEGYSQRERIQNLPDYDYEPYHFGFLLGVNSMDFSMKQDYTSLGYGSNIYVPQTQYLSTTQYLSNSSTAKYALLSSVEPVPTTGFSIGIIGNLRITDHFDLRFIPTLSFGERKLNYYYIEYDQLAKPIDSIHLSSSIKSTFLEFPLHLKYKGNRINNARPYIFGGGKVVFDLSSDAKKKAASPTDDLSTVALKSKDLYGEFGAGFDFYFDWFKMGVEAKMSYGIRNILYPDNTMYTKSINRLNSKIFQISVTFE
jgi:hypothetical protein